MKIFSPILFISFLSISNILQSQSFCIKAQSGYYFPSLTQLRGDIPNCGFITSNIISPDIGLEYLNASNIIFSATIGFQKDWFNFSEINKISPTLIISKTYMSFPLLFSTGYVFHFGKSPFQINTLAGIGLGLVQSDQLKDQYSFDGITSVINDQGNHLDTEHILINVQDLPMKKILWQARISLALEYDKKSFFVKTFFEARKWLSNFEEIKYHSEHSSTFYQYSQTSDGHFSVRTGYLGVGIGIGWYFNRSKN